MAVDARANGHGSSPHKEALDVEVGEGRVEGGRGKQRGNAQAQLVPRLALQLEIRHRKNQDEAVPFVAQVLWDSLLGRPEGHHVVDLFVPADYSKHDDGAILEALNARAVVAIWHRDWKFTQSGGCSNCTIAKPAVARSTSAGGSSAKERECKNPLTLITHNVVGSMFSVSMAGAPRTNAPESPGPFSWSSSMAAASQSSAARLVC